MEDHKTDILITGGAGFIGSALAAHLAETGWSVLAIDNINSYYDPRLKYARLEHFYGIRPDASWPRTSSVPATGSIQHPVTHPDMPYGEPFRSADGKMTFIRADITDSAAMERIFSEYRPRRVMNLAAQAGVRYSITNPMAYVQTNVVGFTNLLECVRRHPVEHFVYASSSSVYGGNTKTPFAESDRVDSPVSLYAATKKSNELFAHVYSKLYGIPTTGLRFFTVYGPWGRPDMAACLFADAMKNGRPIRVFNNGDLSRDFTFIDDIVCGTAAVIANAPVPSDDEPIASRVFNIGCGHPSQLMRFITLLEQSLGMDAQKEFLPMQPGDVHTTYADTSELAQKIGYRPSVELETGLVEFAKWYKDFDPALFQ